MSEITLDEILTEDLFTLLGMEGLADEEKKEMLEKISTTIHARVYSAIYEKLSEHERDMLNELPSEKLLAYMQEQGFNVPEMILEETILYRMELVKSFEFMVDTLQQQPQAAAA